jgi:hypothetical protein
MTALLAPLLAAVLLTQAQADQRVAGSVIDEDGKPIAGATVEMQTPANPYLPDEPAGAEAPLKVSSENDGRFELKVPPGRLLSNATHLWAHQPLLAIAAVRLANEFPKPPQIILLKSVPRTVKVEGPDGKPIAGARIEPRFISFSGETSRPPVPVSLASALAATTGPDGTATVAYLARRDRLVGARVTAGVIGQQDVPVAEEPRNGPDSPIFVIKLNKTSRLSGRIVDESGQGVAGQTVEILCRAMDGIFASDTVAFKDGPLRTGPDGAFQTPDNLMIGSSYRVVVREPGNEPIISDWIRITEQPLTLAPLTRGTLHSTMGRVIDRQGKAVAGVEVFQSSSGPAQTHRTDSDGAFTLDGLPRETVFLFARCDGFRFHGQMLKPGDHDVSVVLTRTTERPTRESRKLPDPIPLDESRAMARRIMERWWKAAVEKGDENAKFWTVQFLIPADPVGALQKIGAVKFSTEQSRARLQSLAARALARTDFDEGETVAESIADPGIRAVTLAHLADLLPEDQKQRKLAILERAAVQARATSTPSDHVNALGKVAARLLELGKSDEAKALFAEGLRNAKKFKDESFQRAAFAGLLARADLPGAMDLARQASGGRYAVAHLDSIAFGLSWDKPAEVEQFLKEYPPGKDAGWLTPKVTWNVATLDPRRARLLVDNCRDQPNYFMHEFCLALGAKGRDEAISRAAIQAGVQALNQTLKKRPLLLAQAGGRLLPIAEAIDPALVDEVMWIAIAALPPTARVTQANMPGRIVESSAWYDRDVAAALLAPRIRRMEQAADRALANWERVLDVWALIDPRAAVALLEKTPMTSTDPNDNFAWIYVVEKLSLDRDDRWRKTFLDWAPIFNPANRDVMFDRF